MTTITIPKNKRDELIHKFQGYFEQELDMELGQFDGEFLLDFIIKHKILPTIYMTNKKQKSGNKYKT